MPVTLDTLGKDATFYICCFLRLSDIGSLSSINRSLYSLLQADNIWRAMYLDEELKWRRSFLKRASGPIQFNPLPSFDERFLIEQLRLHAPSCEPSQASWKALLRGAQTWRFDPATSLTCLDLLQDHTEVVRSSRSGCNPIQLCSRPFTRHRNSISFRVMHMGAWFRIGFTDGAMPLSDASLLGDDKHGINVGFGRDGVYSHPSMEILLNLPHHLKDGSLITIVWLHELNTFNILVDGRLKKVLQVISREEHVVFPCVQLSFNSRIRIEQDSPFPANKPHVNERSPLFKPLRIAIAAS